MLMDENLVEISLQNPLFIREESKRFIKAAIFNDSLFLSNLSEFCPLSTVEVLADP